MAMLVMLSIPFLVIGEFSSRLCFIVSGNTPVHRAYPVVPLDSGRSMISPPENACIRTCRSYSIMCRRRIIIRIESAWSSYTQSGAKATCCSGFNARATMTAPATDSKSQCAHPSNASIAISGFVDGVRVCHP